MKQNTIDTKEDYEKALIFNTKDTNAKAILFDVDGVLTDGGIIYDDTGLEYNVKDGQIISHLRKLGFVVGRESDVVKLDFHKHGVNDKLIEFKKEYNFTDEEVAYIGDDFFLDVD